MSTSLHFLRNLEVSSFKDARGELNVFELTTQIDFTVKRLYFLSEVPGGSMRGAHAHKNLDQIFLATSGSCKLRVTDGTDFDEVELVKSGPAYFLPRGLWREISSFSSGATCLVLASEPYQEADYIHSFNEYVIWKGKRD